MQNSDLKPRHPVEYLCGWQNIDTNIQGRLLKTFTSGIRFWPILTNLATLWLIFSLEQGPFLSLDVTWGLAGILSIGATIRFTALYLGRRPRYLEKLYRCCWIFLGLAAAYGAAWALLIFTVYPDADPFLRCILLSLMAFSCVIGPYAAMPGFVYVRIAFVFPPTLWVVYQYEDMHGFLLALIMAVWLVLRTDILRGYHRTLVSHLILENTLKEQAQYLENVNHSKDLFLRTMSHELRTPLHAILATSDYLRGKSFPETVQEQSRLIARSGELLLSLINGILDIVKSQAGHQKALQDKDFDLHRQMSDLVELMQAHAGQLGSDIILDIQKAVPQFVSGDQASLRQVILNLLSNAVKFGENKPVTLFVGCVETQRDNTTLCFKVIDQGRGIRKEDQAHIFSDYSQLDNQPAFFAGSGLGLSISRQLAEDIGGQLTLQSDGKSGAEFQLILPLKIPSNPPVAQIVRDIALPALNILIVDDDPINRMIMTRYLDALSLKSEACGSFREACHLVKHQSWDVILLDLNLPDGSGYGMAQDLTDHFKACWNRTPIILAVTANIFQDLHDHNESDVISEILYKPLSLKDLQTAFGKISNPALKIADPINPHRDTDWVDLAYLTDEADVLGKAGVQNMLSLFEAECQKLLREIPESNSENFGRQCHFLASLSGNLGLWPLVKLCQDIEYQAHKGALPKEVLSEEKARVIECAEASMAALRSVRMTLD